MTDKLVLRCLAESPDDPGVRQMFEDRYRPLVEEEVFERLGSCSLFEEAVIATLSRVTKLARHYHVSQGCAKEWIANLCAREAHALAKEIEDRFVKEGRLSVESGRSAGTRER
jgi:hypothetical protein